VLAKPAETGLAKSKADRIAAAAARLRELYARRGQLRVPDKARAKAVGRCKYKHGYELRFRTYSDTELAEVLRLLHTLGIPTGRPYPVSSSGTAVPVYGRERALSAVRKLRLRRPSLCARCQQFAFRDERRPRLAFTTLRQLDVAILMYGCAPMMARRINTTPTLFAEMERLRLVRPVHNVHGERAWILTPRGKEQTRYGRVAYLEWLRSGERTGFRLR